MSLLKAGLTAASLVFLTGQAQGGVDLSEIASGVWVHIGRIATLDGRSDGDIANSAVIVGKESIAVVDTGATPNFGEALRLAIREISNLPIRYVVNTHIHPDHIFGNSSFVPEGAEFVGHQHSARALADRAATYLSAVSRLTGTELNEHAIVLAKTLVDDIAVLDLGERQLELRAWPTAHTNADLTVFDRKSGTLIAGDLVFRDHLPVIDGSLNGWLGLHEEFETYRVEQIVPGHGSVAKSWAEALGDQRTYLQSLRSDLRSFIADGADIQEAVEAIGDPEESWLLVDEFHQRNIVTGFTELEWE